MLTWAGVAFMVCVFDPITERERCDIVQHHVKNMVYYETEKKCKYTGLLYGNQYLIPEMLKKATPVTKIDAICINAVNFRLPGDPEIGTGIDEPEDDAKVVPTPGRRDEAEDCMNALNMCQESRHSIMEQISAIGEKGCGDMDEDPDAPHDPTNDGTASNAIRPDDTLVPQEAF